MLTTKQIHKILLATQNNYGDIQKIINDMAQAIKCDVYIYDSHGKILYQSTSLSVKTRKPLPYEISDFHYSVAETSTLKQYYDAFIPNNVAYIKSSGTTKGTLVIEKHHLTLLEKTLLEMVAGIISLSIK